MPRGIYDRSKSKPRTRARTQDGIAAQHAERGQALKAAAKMKPKIHVPPLPKGKIAKAVIMDAADILGVDLIADKHTRRMASVGLKPSTLPSKVQAQLINDRWDDVRIPKITEADLAAAKLAIKSVAAGKPALEPQKEEEKQIDLAYVVRFKSIGDALKAYERLNATALETKGEMGVWFGQITSSIWKL